MKETIKAHQNLVIFIVIVSIMLFSFLIRLLPSGFFDFSNSIALSDPDNWYNFRQIEVMVHQFPQYNWFDAMTAYPSGKVIDWGPVFTIFASGLAILTGATTRPEIMMAASYSGPIIAAAMVPVIYFLGKTIWSRGAGLAAAIFISVSNFTFFFRSTFGYVDHHAMEVLLSSLFLLSYLAALLYTQKNPPEVRDPGTFFLPVAFSLLAGILFSLGLLNMTTMLLFALIIGIFTVILCIRDFSAGTPFDSLLLVNAVTFGVVTVALLLFGIKQGGFGLSLYSMGQVIAYLLLMAGTFVLWLVSRVSKGQKKTFLLFVLGVAAIFLVLLLVTGSSFIFEVQNLFFGQQLQADVIAEMKGIGSDFVLLSYNFGIVLIAAGFVISVWKGIVERKTEIFLLLVWSFVILVATVQHRRFDYYFAVNVALLSGITVAFTIEQCGKDLLACLSRIRRNFYQKTGNTEEPAEQKPESKGKKKSGKAKKKAAVTVKPRRGPVITIKSLITIAVLIVAVLFVAVSIDNDLTYATNPTPMLIKADWVETMNWLGANTPDPGIDYYGPYNSSFQYPQQSYGVMAWWDYGHYITFLAKRLPVTNPFQDNLKGRSGAAAFFLAQNESDAVRILTQFGGTYVITDTDLVTRKFNNIPQWYDPDVDTKPYKAVLYIPDRSNPSQLVAFEFIRDAYYQSVLTRLHLFDGSVKEPDTGYYLEIEKRENLAYPVVTSSKEMNAEEGRLLAAAYNLQASPGNRAEFLNTRAMNPVSTVPAIRHFRLIHESPGNSASLIVPGTTSSLVDVPLVKVFELVSGAKIKGEGTIGIQLVTNTGRGFVYTQKSVNGEFVVPYSTIDNPHEVRAIGSYRILETNRTVEVTERDVREGREIEI